MNREHSEQSKDNRLPYSEEAVQVRPVRHSDFAIEKEFFDDLSFERKRNRFLGGVADVSSDEIERLCDLDYHDSMAYIAIFDNGQFPIELGMARYVQDVENNAHELAIVLADGVNTQSIGTKLLTHLFDYARLNGIKRLYSIEFRDNMEMKVLAESMGMSRTVDPADIHQLRYTIDL